MAEKNTISILESIKKKIQKFDQPRKTENSGLAALGDEFEYISPKNKNSNEDANSENNNAKIVEESHQEDSVQNHDMTALEQELDNSFSDFLNKAKTSQEPISATQSSVAPVVNNQEDHEIEDDFEGFLEDDHHDEVAPIQAKAPIAVHEKHEDDEDEFAFLNDDHHDEKPETQAPVDDHHEDNAHDNVKNNDEEDIFEDEDDDFFNLDDDNDEQDSAQNAVNQSTQNSTQNQADVENQDVDLTNDNHSHEIMPEAVKAEIPPQKHEDDEDEFEDDFLDLDEDHQDLEQETRDDTHQEQSPPEDRNDISNQVSHLQNQQQIKSPPVFSAQPLTSVSTAVEMDHNHHTDDIDNEEEFLKQLQKEEQEEIKSSQFSSIISEKTASEVSDSIKKLIITKEKASTIASFAKEDNINEIAQQILTPKLEKWLNDNLPQLVEKIVREEIKKILPKE